MVTIVTAIVVAIVMSVIARLKRRTAWHWFALSLATYVIIWTSSVAVLYVAGVHIEFNTPHKAWAAFAGALTFVVIAVVVFAVPSRPRRRAAPREAPPGRRAG